MYIRIRHADVYYNTMLYSNAYLNYGAQANNIPISYILFSSRYLYEHMYTHNTTKKIVNYYFRLNDAVYECVNSVFCSKKML